MDSRQLSQHFCTKCVRIRNWASTLVKYNESDWNLAQIGMGSTDNATAGHPWDAYEHFFDQIGGEVLASADDHVLQASRDVEIPVLIELPKVSAPQNRSRTLRNAATTLFQITTHQGGAADAYLSFDAGLRNHIAVGSMKEDRLPLEDGSHGTDPTLTGRVAVGALLCMAAFFVSALSYLRWKRNEQAMRAKAPLPHSRLLGLLAAILMSIGIAVCLLMVVNSLGFS